MSPHEKLFIVFDRALAEGLESLSADDRELYLIQDFIIEFEMGGLSGYLYNRLPQKSQMSEAVSAMQKHDLLELAELLGEAFKLFESDSESDVAETWADVMRRHDPIHRLDVIRKSILELDDYGIERSSIK